MKYKFEDLEVWKLSLELIDQVYEVTDNLPAEERFNLKSQMIRAGTSISLNIAEGSTSQSDSEQVRFIGYSIRSLIEVIACIRIMEKRSYFSSEKIRMNIEENCNLLFSKLQAFKRALKR